MDEIVKPSFTWTCSSGADSGLIFYTTPQCLLRSLGTPELRRPSGIHRATSNYQCNVFNILTRTRGKCELNQWLIKKLLLMLQVKQTFYGADTSIAAELPDGEGSTVIFDADVSFVKEISLEISVPPVSCPCEAGVIAVPIASPLFNL